jgi:GNAT superfamily N-acetyltransferase
MRNAFAVHSTFDADQNLARCADAIEALAWRDLIAAAPAWLREASGATAEIADDAVIMMAPHLDHLLFNRVVGLGLHEPAFETSIARIMKRYQAAGVARYWIHANPYAQPMSLSRMLAKRGLDQYRRSWVKMMRPVGLITADQTHLTVRAATPGDADTIASIVGPAFDLPQLGAEFFTGSIERPRWHTLIAEDDGEPIAAATLFVDGKIGYFAYAATRPEFRGRGAQRALMKVRGDIALTLGCEWLVTETGFPITADEASPSYHNMLWAGFRPVAVRHNYGLPGTAWQTLAAA